MKELEKEILEKAEKLPDDKLSILILVIEEMVRQNEQKHV